MEAVIVLLAAAIRSLMNTRIPVLGSDWRTFPLATVVTLNSVLSQRGSTRRCEVVKIDVDSV
jgi:hypothetical protein